MRIVGIALVWVGVVMLLKAIGIIPVVTSAIIWAVIVIVLGFILKRGGCRHGMLCGKMSDQKICEKCGK